MITGVPVSVVVVGETERLTVGRFMGKSLSVIVSVAVLFVATGSRK